MTAHDETMPPLSGGRREVALAALSRAPVDGELVALPAVLQKLCRAATRLVRVSGACVHVLDGTQAGGVVASSDPVARRIGEAVFTAGEAPGLDAFEHSRPVFAPYLLEEGPSRWPGFVDAVCDSGMRACFSLPLHVGAARLGVLELYADVPGPLQPDQVSWCLTFADLAIELLLEAPPPSSAGVANAAISQALDRRSEIYQAQGMVTVDLGVGLAEALALMRAHAFARDLSLVDVAREIIAGAHLPALGTPSAPENEP